MSKKIPQTKQAKKEFKNQVLDFMLEEPNKVYTKAELMLHFNMSERAVRKNLSTIAHFYGVIATSDKKGYKLAQVDKQDYEEIKHTIAELNCRIKELKARLKPLIADKIVIELLEKENEKSIN